MKVLRLLRVKHRSDGTKRRVVYATIPATRVVVRDEKLYVAFPQGAALHPRYMAFLTTQQRWRMTEAFADAFLHVMPDKAEFDYFEVV